MHVILCHITADFDTLGAAVGLTRLIPGSKIVLTGGAHPAVQQFLALHRDEYALIERRSVRPNEIQSLTIVDTHWRDRLGKAAEWLDLPHIAVAIYDHHDDGMGDILNASSQIDAVGATSTMIVELLQAQSVSLSKAEATVMALGIHVDTGSLMFEQTTVRDVRALAWLMEQGISLSVVADYIDAGLSASLQSLLALALKQLQVENRDGYRLAWVVLQTEDYIAGLSSLIARLMDLTDHHTILLFHQQTGVTEQQERLHVIGRSRCTTWFGNQGIDLIELFRPWDGGGHAVAAAMTYRGSAAEIRLVVTEILKAAQAQMPKSPQARDVMSAPVRTIRPETSIAAAQRILLRYGHSGLSVVNEQDQLVGIISRRDLDIALHHGFHHAPVKGYMTTNLKTITPLTTLTEIERLMVTYDIGRLPVLDEDRLVGIVTRTDVLRELHRGQRRGGSDDEQISETVLPNYCLIPQELWQRLRRNISPELWAILAIAAQEATQRGWHLYLVGGAVRDLLRADMQTPASLADIDLVVDGFHQSAQPGAGMELAMVLQQRYPEARLQIHGRFQTAAVIWHKHPTLDSLMVDIATARTEFYPYPAANPEVEASSIGQDLYRRDFTINAMAIRLTSPRQGELLDFFGGYLDLKSRQIRVLHANSFIEDPTRIYRAVRFAVRLDFQLEPQTEDYIRYALQSGIYQQLQTELARLPALQTRLKNELKYILQAPYWRRAISELADLGALQCIHQSLQLNKRLWYRLRRLDRWLGHLHQANVEHDSLASWQLLLEVLLLEIEAPDRGNVAAHLQLPATNITRLSQWEFWLAAVMPVLAMNPAPSVVVRTLRIYDVETLILIALEGNRLNRRLIWRYLTEWSQIKPLLDGHDLRQLGYRPNPQFKVILEELLAATLDQVIQTKSAAMEWLERHYPRPDYLGN